MLGLLFVKAQVTFDAQGNRIDQYGEKEKKSFYGDDSDSIDKKTVPIELRQWRIDERFGDIKEGQVDTLPHLFQNKVKTEGLTGQYNTLGNAGSPRLSRIFLDRNSRVGGRNFIFASPYDFFLIQPEGFLFSNTKSPTTNITYNECGDKQDGEDRITAFFATNAGKKLGLGFKLDYLYGRGYYANQQTAHFNGSLFASYISDNYSSHFLYTSNYMKTAENGGIESDEYISNPESFPTSYSGRDIPTKLSKVWSKMHVNTFYYTQRYNLGFHRTTDEHGKVVKIVRDKKLKGKLDSDSLQAQMPPIIADSLNDSTKTEKIKMIAAKEEAEDTLKLTTVFVPVTGFIHTMRIDQNSRDFIVNADNSPFFANEYYPGDSTLDNTKNLHIANTLAVELYEGFNKWAKAGMKLFVRHDYNHFTLPSDRYTSTSYNQNEFTLGAQLSRTKGKILRYNLLGEMTTSGDKWGEFNAEGYGSLALPFGKDTLGINLAAYVRNEKPAFYYEHFHSQHAWWDNTLSDEFRTKVEGTLSYKRTKTKLRVGVENIKNYTYFATTETSAGDEGTSYGVGVKQESANIQVVTASLSQDFALGILHWDNEAVYQTTTNKTALPLPIVSLYTNLYLKFKIAKVLGVELGGDLRYFSQYDAPAYSPLIGQYATQAEGTSVKVGNYPVIDVYANFHLKNCRFYLSAAHVNYSKEGGNAFLAPHYPINPMVIRFGISWTFDN